MSGEALYERYKDALKRGHVASLRGRLTEALDAYAEASSIAPERPTPNTSAGTALLRRNRPADALRHYEAALRIAPRDETALLGRAQALAALERRPEAADAFDALADHRAVSGHLADAVDAARRGLELAEGRDRRRTLERLIVRLRASEPGEPGRVALERALRVLEGTAVPLRQASTMPPSAARLEAMATAEAAMAVGDEVDASGTAPQAVAPLAGAPAPGSAPEAGPARETEPGPAPEPASEAELRPALAPEPAPEAEPVAERAPEPASEPKPEPEPEPEPEPGPVVRPALDRDLPVDASLDELTRRAEAALDAGRAEEAVERLLDLAAASRAQGHTAAAMDACYVALSLDPDHVGLHLGLVQLYEDHGWAVLAAEKLDLLDRLVALGEDVDGALRVAAARSGRS